MNADLLRRAAKVLRDACEAATPGPWQAHPDGLVWAERLGDPVSGSTEGEDANYIALMHPPVALALADWLDAMARLVERWPTVTEAAERIDSPLPAAIAVARAILREAAPA